MNIQKHKNFTDKVVCALLGWDNVDFDSIDSVLGKIKSAGLAVEFGIDTNSISTADVSKSVNDPGRLFFTPEGIMLAGYMIANFVSDETIEGLEDRIEAVESVSSGALKYVGTIGEGGILKSINTTEMPDAITRVSDSYIYTSTSSVGTVGLPNVGSWVSSDIDYIDLQQFCEKLAYDYQQNPSFYGIHDVFSLRVDGAWGMQARLFIPTGGASINKVIQFPYDFSSEEITALTNVPNRQQNNNDSRKAIVYIKDNDPDIVGHKDIVGHSGDFLLGNSATILKYTTQTLPITFRTLPSYADVHSGYTFIAQTNSELIPDSPSTAVLNGDMVIVNVDKTAQMGQMLSATDFTIVHIASNQTARRNRAGLMSAEDYIRLYDVLDSYGIAQNGSAGLMAPGKGLVTDPDTGVTDVQLSPTFTQLSGTVLSGIQLRIFGNSGTEVTVPNGANAALGSYNPYIPTATDDRFGVIKLGSGLTVVDGKVCATAQLTWE